MSFSLPNNKGCRRFGALFAVVLILPQGQYSQDGVGKRWEGMGSNTTLSHLKKEISFTLDEDDLADSPVWANPENEPPPLPMRDAIAIAKHELVKYDWASEREWRLAKVELQTIGKNSKWFYSLLWTCTSPDCSGDSLDIPVLMTGKAIPLTVKPVPDK